MPRVKLTNVKSIPSIRLNLDDAGQRRFWEYYQHKTKTGDGLRWIRNTIIESIPTNWKTQLAAQKRSVEDIERLSNEIFESVHDDNDGDDENDGD